MTDELKERYPAQLPPNFYWWAVERSKNFNVSMAEVLRQLPDTVDTLEQRIARAGDHGGQHVADGLRSLSA